MNLDQVVRDVLDMSGYDGHIERVSKVTMDDITNPNFEGAVNIYDFNNIRAPDIRQYFDGAVYYITDVHTLGSYNGDPDDPGQFYELGYVCYEDGIVEPTEDWDAGEISAHQCLHYCDGDFNYIITN